MKGSQKEHDFLIHMIFAPAEVWLTEEYEEILLGLNLWPKGMMHEQKVALLKQDEFMARGTTYYTRQPELMFKSKCGKISKGKQ